MVAARLTSVLAVVMFSTAAHGGERSGSFGVAVEVRSQLTFEVAGVATAQRATGHGAAAAGATWVVRLPATASVRGGFPAALVSGDPAVSSLPCGQLACRITIQTGATDLPPDRALLVTFLPDGAPIAIVER